LRTDGLYRFGGIGPGLESSQLSHARQFASLFSTTFHCTIHPEGAMTRAAIVLALLLPVASGMYAQRVEPPRFVSVSIAQSKGAASGENVLRLQPGGVFTATNVTVRKLIEYAFQRHAFDRREVAGGPRWIDDDRYDIVATSSADHIVDADASFRTTWAMIRSLLADRFSLSVHEENRTRPLYALVLSAGPDALGPRLHRTDVDCGVAAKQPMSAMRPGQSPPCSVKMPPGRLFANTMSMPAIASLLSQQLDRPVVDKTGLTGRFDMELEASDIKAPSGYKPGPSDAGLPPVTGPTVFIAVEAQLGLKLKPEMGTVPVIVIDRIERPKS
jgi:uncharacterized protein (TIGR03435 family)